jgi:hypothetical protein
MQKKFNDGDVVKLKEQARVWAIDAYGKAHIVGNDLICENGKTVRDCVDSYPNDFILVTKMNFGKPTQPHKHAELIKKWADGAEIQLLTIDPKGVWIDDRAPAWQPDRVYRVKPAEREFPKTSLNFSDLYEEGKKGRSVIEEIMLIANLAIKQYILDMEKENGVA